jgi:hypothetical protein
MPDTTLAFPGCIASVSFSYYSRSTQEIRMGSVAVPLRLPSPMVEALEQYSALTGQNRSEVLREGLIVLLRRAELWPPRQDDKIPPSTA